MKPTTSMTPPPQRSGGVPLSLAVLHLLAFVLVSPIASGEVAQPVETYGQLLSAIRETVVLSRTRIEAAVEHEKVREAWAIGKLIDAHVLQHQDRADYGEHTIKRLAEDLGMSQRELYYMLEFARAFPIVPVPAQLSWTHYRELLAVNEPRLREELAKQAEKEHWGSSELRREIQERVRAVTLVPPVRLPDARPGQAGTYRVLRPGLNFPGSELVLDLGFSTYLVPPAHLNFHEGDIVRVTKGKLERVNGARETSLYTYPILVKKVLDGDTLTALVDLGFGVTTLQTLRLRGIDAREIESHEGRDAKVYLERALASGPVTPPPKYSLEANDWSFGPNLGGGVTIRAAQFDKYNRYLADVFVGNRYINQELVARGLAVVVEEE